MAEITNPHSADSRKRLTTEQYSRLSNAISYSAAVYLNVGGLPARRQSYDTNQNLIRDNINPVETDYPYLAYDVAM